MKIPATPFRSVPAVKTMLSFIAVCIAALLAVGVNASAQTEDLLTTQGEVGHSGGGLVVAQRVEPKTLNPVIAADAPSREVIWRTMADLVHINRQTQKTEPALAKSWKVSPDGRRYTLALRRGIRFSDGHPFDADDIVFSFQVYLDEKVASPQRDLLIVGGKPIEVRKLDLYTVEFDLAEPYAPGERLFDSIAMLPRHLLQKPYEQGNFPQLWRLDTPPDQIAGLGPYRVKEYAPGVHLVLERNPYYWKADQRGNHLPYLERITFLFVGTEDAQALRFQAGDTDVVNRLSAESYFVLAKDESKGTYRLYDAGPSLEYNFLLFNLNNLGNRFPQIAAKQKWFQDLKFREAVSAAVDREAIVRLVYRGKGTPLWGHVTPGNKLWVDSAIPRPPRSLGRARELLKSSGFKWVPDGTLVGPAGEPVTFSILVASGNAQRSQMATIIQDDLRQIGMRVNIVPMDFRSMVDRVTKTEEYEAAIMGLGSGDADPASEMNVWLSSGAAHLWDLHQSRPATTWEAEIDRLMQQQLTATQYAERKRLYDRVQMLVAENLPIICLASPHVLVGAKAKIGNFRPAVLEHYTLWNVEELFWRQ